MLLFHQQHDTTCREDEGDLVENQQDGLMTQQTGAAVHGHSLFSPTSKKK